MLSRKKIVVPENLINLAKKSPFVPVGIVCAHHQSSMESCKQAYDLGLINPIFIGNAHLIQEEAERLKWDIKEFAIIEKNSDQDAATAGAQLACENKIKILIKGNLHTDILMRVYLKKEFGLIKSKRLSHIWHMSLNTNDNPLFITDGALNVAPRVDIKMHILKNAVEFAKKIGIKKPHVAILSGTEDPIKSMPSSMEAKEVMKRAIKENIDAFVQGPLAFDNAISLEAGNSLSKIMVYFLGACAAGIVVGGKVPVVVNSRADQTASRLSSIAAASIAAQ